MKWTDSDLPIPAVLWAYRTTWKKLATQALLRLEYEATTINLIVLGELRPHMITLVDTKIRRTLEVEIQQGNLKLRKLKKDRVRLRGRSIFMVAKAKNL